jgi:tetratricopeptide (TPR) repeat protein
MRTTASYDLFPDAPSERVMARARWLAREGRVQDAESAYRELLKEHPDVKPIWAECFELLRSDGRAADALQLAEGARAQFGESAFSFTLVGAALIELGRFRDALAALEQAIEHDPDLGIAWHELGLAAYRLGDRSRALLALDRAFGLDPHTETLKLRGRVLREAGRFAAAEVAFEGAAQAAEHAEQREEAEREILTTRRYAFYAPRRPQELNPAERWFAETGAVVLTPDVGPVSPSDDTLVEAFVELARDRGWSFGQIAVAGPSLPVWAPLAAALDAPLVGKAGFDPDARPLVVSPRPLHADPTWQTLSGSVKNTNSGLVFVLEHPGDEGPASADVIGVLTDEGERRRRMPNAARALSEAQHPVARFAERRLGPP